MLLVGLTGGIGSGKSTVAARLAERGAVILDADDFARQAIEPGTPGYAKVTEAFGHDVVRPDGQIDRERLAGRIFGDIEARGALESIIHPEVARLFADAAESFRETDRIVVYVVPLLVEGRLQDVFDLVVAVTAPEEVRISRLVNDRGMDRAAIRDRMAAQVPEEERLLAADAVVDNAGTLEELEGEIDRLWTVLSQRAQMR